MSPWRITTVDRRLQLEFEPCARHSERKNLGIVRSDFTQLVGLFSGTIALETGRVLELSGVSGVTEDQAMVW